MAYVIVQFLSRFILKAGMENYLLIKQGSTEKISEFNRAFDQRIHPKWHQHFKSNHQDLPVLGSVILISVNPLRQSAIDSASYIKS